MSVTNLTVSKTFRLGAIYVEPARNIVRHKDKSFSLEPRIMDVLCVLAENAGDVVSRDTLIEAIWQVEFGGEDSLSRAISVLRKTFREAGVENGMIETIPKRGYRLAVPVVPIEAPAEADTSQPQAITPQPDTPAPAPAASSDQKLSAVRGSPLLVLIVLAVAMMGFTALLWPKSETLTENVTVSTVVETPERSLAVLPFEDLSPARDQEYFSDGISEEILNVLTKLEGLRVAGRTSSFSFKDKDSDLREIGEALNVAYVMEGSVLKQEERLRIRVRLVEAEGGYHVWSETYDRNLTDIFAVQDEIARAVAEELNLVLQGSADTPLARQLTTSVTAHDLVLRARAAYRQSPDAETFEHAEGLLRQAVELDPNYVDAWIAIATLNNFASGYVGARSPQIAFETAREAIDQARQIDPDSALTLIWSANISYFEGDLVEAFRLAELAIAQEPENEGIVFSFGHYNAIFGYTQRATPYLERATRLDPLDGFAWHTRALVSQNLGEFERAEAEAKQAIELGDFGAIDVLTWGAHEEGDTAQAMEHHMALFEAGIQEADPGLGARVVWTSVGEAIFEEDENQVTLMRNLLSFQFNSDGFETGAMSVNLAAKLGMYDALYEQWRASYATKSTLAVSIWSDFDWARALRQHEGFGAFAEREGFVDLWQTYGWPDACQPDPGTDGSDGQFSCV